MPPKYPRHLDPGLADPSGPWPRDAGIGEGGDDLPAASRGDLSELGDLVLDGLPIGADSDVQRGAAGAAGVHGRSPPSTEKDHTHTYTEIK